MMFFYLLFIIFILLYWFIKKRNNYWVQQKVIQKKSNLIFGEMFDFLLRKQSINEIYVSIYNAYPNERYVGIYEFFQPKLFIRDPELVGHILAKDFSYFHERQGSFDVGGRLIYSLIHLTGEKWRSARNKIMPIFSQHKLKQMYELIDQCSEILIDKHLKPAAISEESIDIRDLMSKFALDVIGTCAFGLNFNMLEKGNAEFIRIAKMAFNLNPVNLFRMFIQQINPNLITWFGMKHAPDEMENFFFDLLEKIESSRKSESQRRNDFVQLMLDIRDEENQNGENSFTNNHIASNMMIFYIAGHETTSLTLSYALYELALNQDIQDTVRDEIQKVLKKYNGKIDYDAAKELTYLEMVISETLRIHSPAAATARLCTKTYKLPGTSLVLNPGQFVICSISGIHYDEKYYPNPHKFDPERFNVENTAKRSPFTYLPFGDGPRICMGLRFAKIEMKCCLASLLSRYKFIVCDKTDIPLKEKLNHFFFNADVWLSVQKV